MAFDGPMLAAAVVQALAAIPTAWREVYGFLSGPKPDAPEALKRLERLRGHLIDLCVVDECLNEAKDAHDLFHHLDAELEEIRKASDAPIDVGPFVEAKYDPAVIRKVWRKLNKTSFAQLFLFAKNIKYIEPQPLLYDNKDQPLSGPYWVLRFHELRDAIERYFSAFDKKRSMNPHDLYLLMDELDSHTKSLMFEANQKIINVQAEFGRKLREMQIAIAQ